MAILVSHLPDPRDQFAVNMQITGDEAFVQLKEKEAVKIDSRINSYEFNKALNEECVTYIGHRHLVQLLLLARVAALAARSQIQGRRPVNPTSASGMDPSLFAQGTAEFLLLGFRTFPQFLVAFLLTCLVLLIRRIRECDWNILVTKSKEGILTISVLL